MPPERLSISVTPAVITITPDRGAARTVQPGRRDDSVPIGPISVMTNAKWEADRLTVAYNAETGRIVRYTYSLNPSTRQLIVDVEFVGRGGGDKVRRVYNPSPPGEPASTPAAAPSSTGLASPSTFAPTPGSVPAAPPPPPTTATLDQRPDAALKGLTRLGLVVEGIGAEAAKCGLKEDALTAAVTKHLTEGGLRVLRDTDDDTYLYVNVNAVTASAGLCVSRYDVTLYSHAAAPLRAHLGARVAASRAAAQGRTRRRRAGAARRRGDQGRARIRGSVRGARQERQPVTVASRRRRPVASSRWWTQQKTGTSRIKSRTVPPPTPVMTANHMNAITSIPCARRPAIRTRR